VCSILSLTSDPQQPTFSELGIYHSEHAGSLDATRATYLISGEPQVSYLDSVRDSEEMAVDDEVTAERSESVYETKITLVGEAELEGTISFPFDLGTAY
jgi:hypothetical protein